ncbi:uncharacterized protein [Argopecten irradians]|uniref:uncharacterized protein isoform X4 n=1 Tax=Argopecten irradians TaxID=31199 RepID=UPI00371DE2C0
MTSFLGFSLPLLWMELVYKEQVEVMQTTSATPPPKFEGCMIPPHFDLATYNLSRLAALYHNVGKYFSFTEEMAKTFGCFVYAFDPGLKRTGRRHLERLLFSPEGINNYTGIINHRRMRTLKDIRHHYGHSNRTIDVITLDITPTELVVIPHALENGDLHSVKQLNIRLGNPALILRETADAYISRLDVLRDLCFFGFRSWIINEDNKCLFHSEVMHKHVIGCHEISFLNLRYI